VYEKKHKGTDINELIKGVQVLIKVKGYRYQRNKGGAGME